jgi:hypothetical protein
MTSQTLKSHPKRVSPLWTIVGLVFTVVGIWWIYSQALPGRYLFDDVAFLGELQSVHDFRSALVFLLSGDGGPLGRPLALATFALQADAWPDRPAALLQVNLMIHLAATAAVFLLAAGMARLRMSGEPTTATWVGLGVAALWGLSPFLATTHLVAWQRVTSLAGLFVLLGLAALVWAHLIAEKRPRVATALLIGGLGGGLLLGAFSKENGALLPLLALTVLVLWVPNEQRLQRASHRLWIILLALIPGLIVIGYLLSLVPGILEHGYGAHRYYTPTERLMSQPGILLDYLRNLLAPRAMAVTPFMDRLTPPAGWLDPPTTLGAIGLWLTLLSAAVWLRRRAPYFLFGVAFFLIGHLIESSIVGVELYFAHRNYVPAFGIYFALVFGLASVPKAYVRVVTGALAAYALLFALVLWQASTAWHDTATSAELWYLENPHSERAAQFLATQYLARNEPIAARRILDEAARRNPEIALLQIQRTQICVGEEHEFPELLAEVTNHLREALYQPNAVTELSRAIKGEIPNLCPARDFAALVAMTDALAENPAYARSVQARSYLLAARAFISAESGNTARAIEQFVEAFHVGGQIDNAFFAAALMIKSGHAEDASRFIDEVRSMAPEHPVRRYTWRRRVDRFAEIVNLTHAASDIRADQG